MQFGECGMFLKQIPQAALIGSSFLQGHAQDAPSFALDCHPTNCLVPTIQASIGDVFAIRRGVPDAWCTN